MKTKTTLTVILIFYLAFDVGWAQPYESIFGKDSTKFNILIQIDAHIFNDSYSIRHKTKINDTSYFVVINAANVEIAYVYEDTINGKAWCYENLNDEGRLIYDFTLEKGDTFLVRDPGEWQGEPEIVATVDSVYFMNEKKVIELDYYFLFTDEFNDFQLKFIEGTGSTYGLFYQFESIGFLNNYLLCWEKDGSLEYITNYDNFDCNTNINISISEKTSGEEFAYFKYCNKYEGAIFFSNPYGLASTYYFYDSQGRLLRTSTVYSDIFRFNFSNLNNGIYFYRIKRSDNISFSGKILINKM